MRTSRILTRGASHGLSVRSLSALLLHLPRSHLLLPLSLCALASPHHAQDQGERGCFAEREGGTEGEGQTEAEGEATTTRGPQ